MEDMVYVNSYDVEDHGLAYICGTGNLDSDINGVPIEVVSEEGQYQNTEKGWQKLN